MIPALLNPYMFFDGLTYAAIARNLTEDGGSWFQLHYSESLIPDFYGHPPLWIWIEALYFRFVGDFPIVEKSCSVFVFGLGMFLLGKCVKPGNYWMSLIPLTVTLCWWIPGQNLLEIPMTVCLTGMAALLMNTSTPFSARMLGLQSLLMIAALGFKGPVALFILVAFPLFGWLYNKNWKHGLLFASGIVSLTSCFYTLLYLLSDEAAFYMREYFTAQALNSAFEVATAKHRFYVLERLVLESLPLIFGAILLYIRAIPTLRNTIPWRKISFWFILGLCGILPFCLILKQSAFYIFPGLWLMLPGWAYLFRHLCPEIEKLFQLKIAKLLLIFPLLAGIYSYKKPNPQKEIIQHIQTITTRCGNGSPVYICREQWADWELHALLARHGRHDLYADDRPCGNYRMPESKPWFSPNP